ncbi:MAG: indolepyruvate oxidoreductase subunit beta [Deltaproteobacteria bacterium]|nr:indolepyruvate oxidoreductase subunit beta [Deltaproteobacteria bacterium]MBM4325379.1 indolepyruvate oxidoreductase subunit beta [Deltaproteobacteria bacterium]
MEDKVTNVLLSGVGGQGTILASDILCSVFHEVGYDVKKSEVHGMAQRGGDVTTHFRFGKKVYSPLIKYGDVDFLISFELLEGLRYINWVKKNGKVLLNDQETLPPAVTRGTMKYPADVVKTFRKLFKKNTHVIDGLDIAVRCGDARAVNIVTLGAFSNFFDIKEEVWEKNLLEHLPEKVHTLNLNAFREGRKAI